MEHFSFELREKSVFAKKLWLASIRSFSYRNIKGKTIFALSNLPIRNKIKLNNHLVSQIFPRFRQFACFYISFRYLPEINLFALIGLFLQFCFLCSRCSVEMCSISWALQSYQHLKIRLIKTYGERVCGIHMYYGVQWINHNVTAVSDYNFQNFFFESLNFSFFPLEMQVIFFSLFSVCFRWVVNGLRAGAY